MILSFSEKKIVFVSQYLIFCIDILNFNNTFLKKKLNEYLKFAIFNMNHETNSFQIKNIHDEQTHLMLNLSFDSFISCKKYTFN